MDMISLSDTNRCFRYGRISKSHAKYYDRGKDPEEPSQDMVTGSSNVPASGGTGRPKGHSRPSLFAMMYLEPWRQHGFKDVWKVTEGLTGDVGESWTSERDSILKRTYQAWRTAKSQVSCLIELQSQHDISTHEDPKDEVDEKI